MTVAVPAIDARTRARAELGMLLVVIVWGANFGIVKWTLAEIPPFAFAAFRFSVSALCLCAIAWIREGPPRFPPGTAIRVLWLGIAGNSIYQVLFMIGLTRTSVGNVALLAGCSPVLVALFGWLTGIEQLSRTMIAGVGLCVLGIALVVGVHDAAFTHSNLLGDLAIVVAAVAWAAYTVGVRTVSDQVSVTWLTASTTLAGAPILLLVGGRQLTTVEWGTLSTRTWIALAYTTLISLVLAYLIWNASIRLVGSVRTSVFSAGMPVVGMILAWPLVGERPRMVQVAGSVLIVGGVLLARWRGRESGK